MKVMIHVNRAVSPEQVATLQRLATTREGAPVCFKPTEAPEYQRKPDHPECTLSIACHEFCADPHTLLEAGISHFDVREPINMPILDALERIERRQTGVPLASAQMYNERINVHVPGLGLLAIEQVLVEKDCCTESLDVLLKEGRRTVATCPQPDQRRPDYVLGRAQRHESE